MDVTENTPSPEIKDVTEVKKKGLRPGREHFIPKINDEQRLFILQSYAQGQSCRSIVGEIKRRWGITYSFDAALKTCKAKIHQDTLNKFREMYLSALKEVPIANKRIRMNDLEMIRLKLIAMLGKVKIETTHGRSEMLMILRRLNETLCVAREEMEKNPTLIQNNINLNNLEDLSDDELQKRKEALIAKATGTYTQRDFGIGETDEGITVQSPNKPVEVPVAASEELHRE